MLQILQQHWQLIGFFGALLATLLLVRFLRRESYCPYHRRGELLTINERKFYFALRQAITDEYAIFAMVRIADLLKVESGATQRQAWQNRINAKHVDFVLCDVDTLEVVLAIEVDDRSHQRPDRQRRDEFVDDAFQAAGLSLLRVPARSAYSPREIQEQIRAYLPLRRSSDRTGTRRRRRRARVSND